MKAALTLRAGGPEVIQVRDVPLPTPTTGWVLIQVKAFGLNRSELFTRRGDSPGVQFPRIQGIECVGVVANDPSGQLATGQQVAALMGGMGRDFDGGYAEYALVPTSIVFPFKSTLPWSTLGAIPEMFQTVSGSLHQALEVQPKEVLLIRGGTSSIGLLACQLAKTLGIRVIATTRNPQREQFLLDNGADEVLIDDGHIAPKLQQRIPQGVHKVLELIGTTTLKDSLQCIGTRGIVCMTGILGNSWTMDSFTPMGDIPSTGRLTVYMGDAGNIDANQLQQFIDAIENNQVRLNIDSVFRLDQIVQAHEYMEANRAKGKVVVALS